MSGKRIRQLGTTDTPPAGALLPLDAIGLPQAQAITPKDLVDAASYTLTVVLGSNAADNRAAIEGALTKYAASGNTRGTLRLPKGVYEVSYTVFLTGAHSGLTIEGDGCVLFRTALASTGFPENSVMNIGVNTPIDPMGRGDPFTRNPMNLKQLIFGENQPVRYDNFQVGDAIILYKSFNPGNTRQQVQQVAVITAKDVPNRTITVDANILDEANLATYLFNGRKAQSGGIAAGATTIRIPQPVSEDWFPPQSWIYVTDGVGELEAYGEFVRVTGVNSAVAYMDVFLETALRNSYLDGRAAVVPSSPDPEQNLRTRWLEDIMVRGLTFGGAPFANGQNADLAAKFSVNLTLERVNCVLRVAIGGITSNGFIVTTSDGLVMRQCYGVEGGQALALNGVRNSQIETCRVTTSMEEFCSDITFRDCDIVRAYNQLFGTARVAAIDCRFWNLEQFAIGDDSSMIRSKVIGSKTPNGDLAIGGNRFTVHDLHAIVGPMRLVFRQTGTGHTVGRVRGTEGLPANVTVLKGSGGRIDGPIDGTITAENVPFFPMALPGSWTYTTDVQIPLTFGDGEPPKVIGHLVGRQSAMWLRVTVIANLGDVFVPNYISLTHVYEIARGYRTANAWYTCLPQCAGARDLETFEADFVLELYEDGNDAWLRLSRTLGSVSPVDVNVRIQTNAMFEPGGTAPTAGLGGVHESTTVSQRNGLAYLHGPVITRNTAPAIDDLKAKECALWYDPSDTAPRLVVRARTNDGTLANLALALTPEP